MGRYLCSVSNGPYDGWVAYRFRQIRGGSSGILVFVVVIDIHLLIDAPLKVNVAQVRIRAILFGIYSLQDKNPRS